MQVLSLWDDIQLIIPFILGVLFFRFCVPRWHASSREAEDVFPHRFSKKDMVDDDELVSTEAGSDTDEPSEDLSVSPPLATSGETR